MFIGNPIAILGEKVGHILFSEFSTITITIKNVEGIIKRVKERVKNELDREIEINFPHIERLKTGFSFGNPFDSLAWMEGSVLRIIPKKEDREIQELFHTFPVGDNLLV